MWSEAIFPMKYEPYFKWVVARLLIVAANIGAVIAIPAEKSNIDWPACFLIAIIFAAALFAWLTIIRFQQGIEWSQPYSWRQPFWPLRKYPLRYASLISLAFIIAGAVGMMRGVILRLGHVAVSGTFFFIGFFIMLALEIWIRTVATLSQR